MDEWNKNGVAFKTQFYILRKSYWVSDSIRRVSSHEMKDWRRNIAQNSKDNTYKYERIVRTQRKRGYARVIPVIIIFADCTRIISENTYIFK